MQCPHCRRDTDWLIASFAGRVDFACRCGHGWQVSADLAEVVAMAEDQPRTAGWRNFDDVRRDLGFQSAAETKRARTRGKAREAGPDNVIPLHRGDLRRPPSRLT